MLWFVLLDAAFLLSLQIFLIDLQLLLELSHFEGRWDVVADGVLVDEIIRSHRGGFSGYHQFIIAWVLFVSFTCLHKDALYKRVHVRLVLLDSGKKVTAMDRRVTYARPFGVDTLVLHVVGIVRTFYARNCSWNGLLMMYWIKRCIHIGEIVVASCCRWWRAFEVVSLTSCAPTSGWLLWRIISSHILDLIRIVLIFDGLDVDDSILFLAVVFHSSWLRLIQQSTWRWRWLENTWRVIISKLSDGQTPCMLIFGETRRSLRQFQLVIIFVLILRLEDTLSGQVDGGEISINAQLRQGWLALSFAFLGWFSRRILACTKLVRIIDKSLVSSRWQLRQTSWTSSWWRVAQALKLSGRHTVLTEVEVTLSHFPRVVFLSLLLRLFELASQQKVLDFHL